MAAIKPNISCLTSCYNRSLQNTKHSFKILNPFHTTRLEDRRFNACVVKWSAWRVQHTGECFPFFCFCLRCKCKCIPLLWTVFLIMLSQWTMNLSANEVLMYVFKILILSAHPTQKCSRCGQPKKGHKCPQMPEGSAGGPNDMYDLNMSYSHPQISQMLKTIAHLESSVKVWILVFALNSRFFTPKICNYENW